MGYLKINQEMLTEEKARTLVGLCPFGAMSWEKDKLEISAACKMCKLCVRNSGGAVEYVEKIASFDKFQWKGICVYADCLGGKLHRVTLELCGKARELAKVTGHEVYALVIGHKTEETAQKLLRYGVDKVFVYDHEALKDFRIEPYTALFCDFIGQYRPSSVLVGATTLGRQLAPRVAARCRTGLTADCTVLQMKENTDLVQIRPAFGGNIMAQIVTPNTRPQFCTARYKVFTEPAETEPTGQIVKLPVDPTLLVTGVKILHTEEKPKVEDISEAEVIVAVGRGASDDRSRALAQELADLLGGVVACTRPLAEAGIYDARHQIGLSGRTVKPRLIITLGISGAVQFASGMKGADCIVAVNTDPHAPIFDIAHYGIPGDAGQILPQLIRRIKEGL